MSLTTKQIMDETDLRKLDKWMAELLFGWTSIGVWTGLAPPDPSDWVGCPPGWLEEFRAGKRDRTIDRLPYYTTDVGQIDTLEQQVGKLGLQRWYVYHLWQNELRKKGTYYSTDSLTSAWETLRTTPLQRVRAALLAYLSAKEFRSSNPS